ALSFDLYSSQFTMRLVRGCDDSLITNLVGNTMVFFSGVFSVAFKHASKCCIRCSDISCVGCATAVTDGENNEKLVLSSNPITAILFGMESCNCFIASSPLMAR